MRSAPALGLVLALVALLIAPSAHAGAGQPEQLHLRWLALGDSYSSGEGIYGAGKGLVPVNDDACARSRFAWARLAGHWVETATDPTVRKAGETILGVELAVPDRPIDVDMTFLACSGAETTEAGEAQDLDEQLDQLNEGDRFDVITFSFGGNDAKFGPIIKGCLNPKPRWGCDETEEQMTAHVRGKVAENLDVAYHKIRERLAPGGRVIVLGYPRLFDKPHRLRAMCYDIPKSDIEMLRRVANELNATIARAAERHRFDFVDVVDPFEGRNACGTGIDFPPYDVTKWLVKETGVLGVLPVELTPLCLKMKWVNGVAIGAEVGLRHMHSFHPNFCGHFVESLFVASRVLGWEALGDARVKPRRVHLYHRGIAMEIADHEIVHHHFGDPVGPIADQLTELFGLPGAGDVVPLERLPCGPVAGRMTWQVDGAAVLSLGVNDGKLVSYQQYAEHPAIDTPDHVAVGSAAWELTWQSHGRLHIDDESTRIGADVVTAYRFTRVDSTELGDPPRTGHLTRKPEDLFTEIISIRDGMDTPPECDTPIDKPPTSSAQPTPTPAPPARTKEVAIQRFEQFLHALGAEDIRVVCEIAGPAAKKAQDQGFGPCESTYGTVFRMISPEQKTALKSATVDSSRVIVRESGEVRVPVGAVRSSATFTENDLGSYTLSYLDNNWFITD